MENFDIIASIDPHEAIIVLITANCSAMFLYNNTILTIVKHQFCGFISTKNFQILHLFLTFNYLLQISNIANHMTIMTDIFPTSLSTVK